MKNIYIYRAIKELVPEAEFGLRDDDITTLQWNDTIFPRPSDDVILAKVEELKALDEKNQYQPIRARNYPSVQSQLDQLWHMMDDGTIPGKGSDWYNTILDVKNKYPKDMIVVEGN